MACSVVCVFDAATAPFGRCSCKCGCSEKAKSKRTQGESDVPLMTAGNGTDDGAMSGAPNCWACDAEVCDILRSLRI